MSIKSINNTGNKFLWYAPPPPPRFVPAEVVEQRKLNSSECFYFVILKVYNVYCRGSVNKSIGKKLEIK